jgi:hypothetical protein
VLPVLLFVEDREPLTTAGPPSTPHNIATTKQAARSCFTTISDVYLKINNGDLLLARFRPAIIKKKLSPPYLMLERFSRYLQLKDYIEFY